jgi:SAM-dependent methyltransferase
MTTDRERHWEQLYRSQPAESVSWFEAAPTMSLALLDRAGLEPQSSVIDVGGGASRLVDRLLVRGVQHVTVLDIAPAALDLARARLGDGAASVTWMAADVLTASLPPAAYDLWHDRAVFHFLTAAADRARYVAQLTHSLRPNGSVILATFAEDGPPRCSGLDVVRYAPDSLARELGPVFELCESLRIAHSTPRGATQSFLYTRWARATQ